MRPGEITILAALVIISGAIISFSMRCGGPLPQASQPQQHEDPDTAYRPVVHMVEKGETLGVISQRYYGTHRRWLDILEANEDILQLPESLKPGMVLVIPRLSKVYPTEP